MKHGVNTLRINRLSVVFSFALLLCLNDQAQAVVLDFEHLSTASYGGVHVNFVEEDGFLVFPIQGSLSVFEDGWQSGRGASNGTNTMGTYGPETTLVFGLESIDGSAFSLHSIDLTGLLRHSDPDWLYNTDSVTFVGELNDGGTITDVFILDNVNDGIGGAVDFETYVFSSGWSNLASVSFFAHNTNGTYTSYLNFDNISINYCNEFPGGGSTGGCFPGPGPFPAPEPGTFALLGLGLLGLGVTRRRQYE